MYGLCIWFIDNFPLELLLTMHQSTPAGSETIEAVECSFDMERLTKNRGKAIL